MKPGRKNKPIYVFDICSELIAEFSNLEEFKKSSFYKKCFGHYKPNNFRYSTHREQHCIFAKLFITYLQNFVVDYTNERFNHNPLRANQQVGYHKQNGSWAIEYFDTPFVFIESVGYYQHWDREIPKVTWFNCNELHFYRYSACDANLQIRKTRDLVVMHEAFLSINNHYELHN